MTYGWPGKQPLERLAEIYDEQANVGGHGNPEILVDGGG